MNDIENLATPATDEPVPNNPDSEELIDLEAIRMSQSFGAQSEVRKLLTTVPVRKPNRTQFCRTHADYRLLSPRVYWQKFSSWQKPIDLSLRWIAWETHSSGL